MPTKIDSQIRHIEAEGLNLKRAECEELLVVEEFLFRAKELTQNQRNLAMDVLGKRVYQLQNEIENAQRNG